MLRPSRTRGQPSSADRRRNPVGQTPRMPLAWKHRRAAPRQGARSETLFLSLADPLAPAAVPPVRRQ